MFYGCERLNTRLFEFSLHLCWFIKERAKWDLFRHSKYRRETVLHVTVFRLKLTSPSNCLTDFHLIFTKNKCLYFIINITKQLALYAAFGFAWSTLPLIWRIILLSFCQCLPCLSALSGSHWPSITSRDCSNIISW